MERRRSDLQEKPPVVNPFVEQESRDNFPGLDSALEGITFENDSKLPPPSAQQESSFYDGRASPDESICSYASSSLLNMSIGARAALNEHLRHVAVHGIDGGQASPAETSVLSHDHLIQDEVWERLLDGNLSITSVSAPSLFDRLQPVVSISEDGEEAIEVLDVSDSSSDFFNSSRIWQLATPEKNRGVRRPITTRRGDDQYEESDSESQASGMMYLYKVAVGMHETSHHDTTHNSSFLSLGVDLSRISNSDVSDVRSSPDDGSFHQRVFDEADICTPSRRNSSLIRDQSFSTPSRRGLLTPEPSLFSPSRRSVSTSRGGDTLSAADIGLAPIAAQAGSIAGKLGRRPSRRHYPGDIFPLSAGPSPRIMEHEPSPISQANSGFHFPETVGEHCILDMDDKRDKSGDSSLLGLKPRERLSTSPDAKQASPASLSSISAQPSVSKQHSSTSSSDNDRRRYRTVVPARVFMEEPETEYPFQQDSFCSSHSETVDSTTSENSESSSPLNRRSLLVSFDEAADEFEVPLNDS